MKKNGMLIFVLVVMFCLSAVLFTAGQSQKPIVIGMTSDASGNYAESSSADRRGMIMAIEEANAAGGVIGRIVDYIHEDTETDPSAGARKATRLIERDQVDMLIGDASKAKEKLGWKPKVSFKELVRIMVDADMEAVGLKSPGGGKTILAKYGLNTADRALLSNSFGGE